MLNKKKLASNVVYAAVAGFGYVLMMNLAAHFQNAYIEFGLALVGAIAIAVALSGLFLGRKGPPGSK